jgi:hypothetical protein
MKLFSLLLALMLACAPASFALQTEVDTIIDSVTLDADPTAVNSDAVYAGSLTGLSFIVSYDETETGGISAAVTLQMSYDASTWVAASFYDYAGGATLQTTESFTTDTTAYVMWVNPDLAAPYYRVVVTATGSDANDTAVIVAKAALRG